MKSAFWLFVGLFIGLGLSYVTYLQAQHHPLPKDVPLDIEREGDAPSRDGENDQELKSRMGRFLMDLLDEVEGGSEEERRLVRETLRENDRILHETLGDNLKAKIERANNPRPRNFVERNGTAGRPASRPRTFVERDETSPAEETGTSLPAELDPDNAI